MNDADLELDIRVCSECWGEKPFFEFSKVRKNYYRRYCKVCWNRKTDIKRMARRAASNPSAYTKCAYCGVTCNKDTNRYPCKNCSRG